MPKAMSLWCCCSSNQPNSKAKFEKNHLFLRQLHFYGVLTAQTIASSILIAMVLWLFIRFPEPQVHVRGLEVEGLTTDTLNKSTLIHYNITVHNPDRYKSLRYSILVLRVTYSGYSTSNGMTVIFNQGGQGIYQAPGGTMTLPNHTVNYTAPGASWVVDEIYNLKTATKRSIVLRLILEAKLIAFNRVLAKRQIMRMANVYFNDTGTAFVDPSKGILLK